MRVTLLHNPGAGDGSDARDVVRQVERAGHDVTYQSLDDPGWKGTAAAPTDLVVVAGGDGTVRTVFRALAGLPVLLSILPLGTANNVARSLGIATGPTEDLAGSWLDGRALPFDLLMVDAASRRSHAVESIGGGVLAEVLAVADDEHDGRCEHGDKRRRGLCSLRRLLREARPSPWAITADGSDLSGEYLAVEAMNTSESGPNLPLAPDADPGDGCLDLVLVGPDEVAELLAYVEARLSDDRVPPRPPPLPVHRAASLQVRALDGAHVRVDDRLVAGAELGSFDDEVAVVVERSALWVLAPAPVPSLVLAS